MTEHDITTIVLPVLSAHGVDLEECSLRRAGKRNVLQIVVDRDGGVDLDLVADISRDVSAVIDQHPDVIPAQTVLEVSSPGVDRPLTEERHWRRAMRRLVEVTPKDDPVFTDRITALDAGVVQFESGRAMRLNDIKRGIVQVEFTGGSDGH